MQDSYVRQPDQVVFPYQVKNEFAETATKVFICFIKSAHEKAKKLQYFDTKSNNENGSIDNISNQKSKHPNSKENKLAESPEEKKELKKPIH